MKVIFSVILFLILSLNCFGQSRTYENLMPVGTVITFIGSACPTGYLKADGTAVSRTTYSSLFKVAGIAHGSGNGSTTFNLPDYRGRFLRGVDESAGNDPDKATRTAMATGGNVGNLVGSIQADAFQGHQHNYYYSQNGGSGNISLNDRNPYTNGTTSGYVTDGSYGTPRPASETRVKNAYVNFCIKF